MLTPLVANTITFFYPLGNTPAVCLTQHLPPETEADILLLGCGDVRHILFTVHTDNALKQDRKLDVTCCDWDRAVIARNILLFTLVIDDPTGANNSQIWNLYYHFRTDQPSLQLLHSQAQKLCALASSLQSWHKSTYGKMIIICDSGSLGKVREMWQFYGVQQGEKALSTLHGRTAAAMKKANKFRNAQGVGMNLTGFRSASPAHIRAVKDLHTMHEHYWKEGTTELRPSARLLAVCDNPMFASLDPSVILHYGTDPLLGFHLATAYIPLAQNPLGFPSGGTGSANHVVDAAKTEFWSWLTSLRGHTSAVTLRFFVGDALSFSYSLQCLAGVRPHSPMDTYRDRHHFESLALDGADYVDNGTAPLAFNIIDTSNLIDHLGALNVLAAAAPLLTHDNLAAMYTEKLVRGHSTFSGLFNDLICGPLTTLSLLLRLVPMDFVTNTSAMSTGDELLLDSALRAIDKKSDGSGQLFTRIVWKRPKCQNESLTRISSPNRLHIGPLELATILYNVYLKMFEGEDPAQLMSNLSVLKVQRLSLPTYQRASFVAFVSILRSTVETNWDKATVHLRALIENNVSHMLTMNYIQELYVWLHLFNLHSVDTLKVPLNSPCRGGPFNDLRDWEEIPSVVCITLQVPREKLAVITKSESPIPTVQCSVEGSSHGRPWQNCFAAIQGGFGQLECHGKPFSNSFRVSVTEDASGWSGKSPLLVSFYAPAWMLLQQPRTASVACTLQSTPQNVTASIKELGFQLTIYQTTLADAEHVCISNSLPNGLANPRTPRTPPSIPPAQKTIDRPVSTVLSAVVDSKSGHIVSLAARLDIGSSECKNALTAGGQVTSTNQTPFNYIVNLEPDHTFSINMPAPTLESSLKTKIARKSSYIELIAQVATGIDWSTFNSFVYPVLVEFGIVANWNMPYIKMDSLPIIDTVAREQLGWLTPHASTIFSATERSLRDNPQPRTSLGVKTRLDFKDSLFSMFMHYSGLQGTRARMFGINVPGGDGIHILIFVSSLRFDRSNRTVVLDAAVLPLYNTLMPKLMSFIQALTSSGRLCMIQSTEAELHIWKHVLPAMVERCRTWSHKPDCDYLSSGQIPLSFDKGHKLLCSCGNGVLPPSFLPDVPQWKKVAKYAVRAAISPCFSAAMFETDYEFLQQLPGPEVVADTTEVRNVCLSCGKSAAENGSTLLKCSRCNKARYCSRECQRTHWKKHKSACKSD